MKILLRGSLVFVILLILLSNTPAFGFIITMPDPPSAAMVYIDPSSQTVGLGDIVSVDIGISDVTDLFGFEFAVTYDPSIVSLVSVTEGPFFSAYNPFLPGDSSTPGQIGSGTIGSVYDFTKIQRAFGSSPGDPNWDPEVDFNNDEVINIFDLAIISINVTDDIFGLSDGTTVSGDGVLATLTFEAIGIGTSLIELYDVDLSDYNGSPISTWVLNGEVNVPEPASLILLGAGLVGLFAYKRKCS